MKKLIIGVLAVSAISTGSYAKCVAGSCAGTVEKLYMTAGGTMYVQIEGDASKLNCTPPGGVYLSLKEGDVGKNAMYSLLLTAKTTGKPITVRIVEGSTDCRVAFVKQSS